MKGLLLFAILSLAAGLASGEEQKSGNTDPKTTPPAEDEKKKDPKEKEKTLVTLAELQQKKQQGEAPVKGLKDGQNLNLGPAGHFSAKTIGTEGVDPQTVYIINGKGDPVVIRELSENLSAEGKSALVLFRESQASGEGLLRGLQELSKTLDTKLVLVDLAPNAPMNTALSEVLSQNSQAKTPLGDLSRDFVKNSLLAMHNGEMPKGSGIPSLNLPKGFEQKEVDGIVPGKDPARDEYAAALAAAARALSKARVELSKGLTSLPGEIPAPGAKPEAKEQEPKIVKFSDLTKEDQDRILKDRFPDATQEQRDGIRDALVRMAKAKRDDVTSNAVEEEKNKVSAEKREQIEREHFKRASEALPKNQPIVTARTQYPHEDKRGEFIGWVKDGKNIVEMFRVPTAGVQPFANGAPKDAAPLQQQREGLQKEIAKLQQQEGREAQIAKLQEKVSALDAQIREAQFGETFWTNMEKAGQPSGRTGVREGQDYKNPWINHNKYRDDMMLVAKTDPKTGEITYSAGHNGVYDIHPGGLKSAGCHTIPSTLYPDFSKVWASNIDNTKIYDDQGKLLGKTAGFFYGPYRN